MTAVAAQSNIHSAPRSWNGGAPQGINSMTPEVYIPRSKGPQRYSIPSATSSASSLESTPSNGTMNGWPSTLGGKKRAVSRISSITGVGSVPMANGNGNGNGIGIWPKADSNHVRQSVGAVGPNGSTPPASSANGMQNGVQGHQSYLCLLPLNGTFDRKQISLPFYPETTRIGRQTNAKTVPTPNNGYFDSKVLSRQHAELWAEKATGKVWIRDIKSSNGTFVNGQRLSQENQDSEPHELRPEDILELGIDIVGEDNRTIVHHKVSARVEHAGVGSNNVLDLSIGDVESIMGGNTAPSNHMVSQNGLRVRGTPQQPRAQIPASSSPAIHRPAPASLPPVTMEMVVKKLTGELHSAKQQSQDLQRTTELFDLLLAADSTKHNFGIKHSAKQAEIKVLHGVHTTKLPFLRSQSITTTDLSREETQDCYQPINSNKSAKSERADPPQQLLSLVDALAKTRKEMEEKSARVVDLEEALKRERRAREDAEDRAAVLENATRAMRCRTREVLLKELELEQATESAARNPDNANSTDGSQDNEMSCSEASQITQAVASVAKSHQRRMEEMIEELQLAKQTIDSFRVRAEIAEKERDNDRISLAQMIRTLREHEEGRTHCVRDSGCQTTENFSNSIGVQVTAEEARSKSKMINGVASSLTSGIPKETTIMLPRHDMAPYASALGVVLFGVALMTAINGWQRAER